MPDFLQIVNQTVAFPLDAGLGVPPRREPIQPLLAAYAHKEHGLTDSLHKILQVLSVNAFEKAPIKQLLTKTSVRTQQAEAPNLLMLIDL